MHADAVVRAEFEMRSDRLRRIHVVLAHEPAWLIGTNRQQRHINARKPAADLLEVRTISGISGEKHDRAAGLHHEAAPQAAIAIIEPPRRKMLRGHVSDAGARERHALPP